MSLRCKLFGHKWYSALGRSPDQIKGEPRPHCLKYECVRCHQQKEVSRYTRVFTSKICGTVFFGEPEYLDNELTRLQHEEIVERGL